MPEPQGENTVTEESKSSKILEFFSTSVKEPKKEKIKPLTKIVIRRLPPKLTKAAFLEEFELPDHDYFSFVRGNMSMGQYAYSRAYVNFLKADDIYTFKEKYDDYVLQDDQGKEYLAVVEWAPVQKIPKKGGQKKNSLVNTIETDPKYVAFLEQLEKEKNNVGNASEYFMETEGVSSKEVKITTTPLLEFLKVRKQQKLELKLKRREVEKERRRKEDEARKAEKLKKVKEKKIGEKVDDATEAVKSEEKPLPEIKEKRSEVKSIKPDIPIKTRIFEKRGYRKEVAETPKRPKNKDVETKPKKDFEVKKSVKNSYKTENEKKVIEPEVIKPSTKPIPSEPDSPQTNEGKKESEELRKETKSKFRYSEQRSRTQKPVKKEEIKEQKEKVEVEQPRVQRESTQDTSDGSIEGDDKNGNKDDRNKDPRTERRIRNKDRPSMQIYRPGMGRFSKQRIERKKDDDAEESDERKSAGKRDEGNRQESAFKEDDIEDNIDEYPGEENDDEEARIQAEKL